MENYEKTLYFENLLYEASEKAVLEKDNMIDNINSLKRTYDNLLRGIILVFSDIIFLANHKHFHVVLIFGAYFLFKGCGRYQFNNKKMFISHLLWLIIFFSTITYDICYFVNIKMELNLLINHVMGGTYGYEKAEVCINALILNLTIISFAAVMIQFSKNNEKEPEVKEYMFKAVMNFLEETLVVIIVVIFNTGQGYAYSEFAGAASYMRGVLGYIVLIPILLAGKRNMDKGITNMLFSGAHSVSMDSAGTKKKIYLCMEIAVSVLIVVIVAGSMYYPYISKKQEKIIFIKEKEMWEGGDEKNSIVTFDSNSYSDNDMMFREAEEKAEQIKEKLITMGVRQDILDDMLVADILKFDNTGRVLKSSSVHDMEKVFREDIYSSKGNGIQFRTTVYACEKFNGDEKDLENGMYEPSEPGSCIYEVLIYVEFFSQQSLPSLCNGIKIESCMGQSAYLNDFSKEENMWIFMADTDNDTIHYKGEIPKNEEWWENHYYEINTADVINGKNLRAYKTGRIYATSDEKYVDINVSVDMYKKTDYYNEVTKKQDYCIKKSSYATGGSAFGLLIVNSNEEEYLPDGNENYAEDYYDDGYDISKPVNYVLVDADLRFNSYDD